MEQLKDNLMVLVQQLTELASDHFPSNEVSALLRTLPLSSADIAPYIFYLDTHYTRNRVYKAPLFELILMCWQPGQQSAIHGHEGQKCWMRVMQGELVFTDYRDELGVLHKVATTAGEQGFVDGPAYIHSVANASGQRALSLHLYARPFNQCDAYDVATSTTKKIQLGYHSIDGNLV